MNESDRRRQLGSFLRSCRERIKPNDIGLPEGSRRRTPGLRRGEVAELAGIGVDWYGYLEMGRDITVAPKTLLRIAAALNLNAEETSRLFHLAIKQISDTPSPVALASNDGMILDEVDTLIRCLCGATSIQRIAECATHTAHALARRNLVAYFAVTAPPEWHFDFISCVGCDAASLPKLEHRADSSTEMHLLRAGRVVLETRSEPYYLSAPVFEHGTLIGVLGYAYRAPRIPGGSDERVLVMIANTITLALSHLSDRSVRA